MASDIDGNIDYSKYSLRELYEARASIQSWDYPENYANLVAEIKRKPTPPKVSDQDQEPNRDDSDHSYSAQAKSPFKARLTGLGTLAFGVIWLMMKLDGETYYGRNGAEYTFDDDPILLSGLLLMHGIVILIGVLGLIFGSKFYRIFVYWNSPPPPPESKQ